jgi:hypothetical protein
MKRILAYNFSGELDDVTHLFPSERLGRVAAIAHRQGHAVTVIDRATLNGLAHFGAAFMEALGSLAFRDYTPAYTAAVETEAAALLAEAPDLLFMNLWHGTGFKFSFDLAVTLQRLAPKLPIVGIGQKVDWFGAHLLTLGEKAFDGLVTGLGYSAIDGLCAGKTLTELPGIRYLDSHGRPAGGPAAPIDPDDYPDPLYDANIYRDIDAKAPIYTLTLSNQACPNQCVYCIRPVNYGRAVRRRAIPRVIEEMQTLYATRGVTHFRIEDSTPPARALTELAEGILASPLRGRVFLSGFSRVDINSVENFDRLHEAGFVSLFFGIESLDAGVLKRLKKGISVAAVRDTLARAHAAGIHTVGSFIFPTPGETAATMANTLARIAEFKPFLDSALVLPAGVYPPTPWGERPEEFGILLDPDFLDKVIVYPVKYLVPLRHWPRFPLRFDLMGQPATEVTFEDIIGTQERFLNRVRKELGIPGVPDYYFTLAHLLGTSGAEAARQLVGLIMARDYPGLSQVLGLPMPERAQPGGGDTPRDVRS